MKKLFETYAKIIYNNQSYWINKTYENNPEVIVSYYYFCSYNLYPLYYWYNDDGITHIFADCEY